MKGNSILRGMSFFKAVGIIDYTSVAKGSYGKPCQLFKL